MNTTSLDSRTTQQPEDKARQGGVSRYENRLRLATVSPSVLLLLVWMIVPLAMTIYFSTIRYNLLYPGENDFVGLENFYYFITDAGFLAGAANTLILVGSVLLISVVLGVLISVLVDIDFWGARPGSRHVDIPVFYHANRQRAGLEEPAAAPGVRYLRGDLALLRCHTGGLVHSLSDALHHHDCVVAVAALRHPDPDDGHAITGSGTERCRPSGRCRPAGHLLAHHTASPVTAYRRRGDDRDHLPAVGIC